MFSTAICRPTGDKWQSNTLFREVFDTPTCDKWQSKKLFLAIFGYPTGEKWQSKTLFLAIVPRVRQLLIEFSIAAYPVW